MGAGQYCEKDTNERIFHKVVRRDQHLLPQQQCYQDTLE